MSMFVLVLSSHLQSLDDNALDSRQNTQTKNHNISYRPHPKQNPFSYLERPVMDDNYGLHIFFFSINVSAFGESP
jgi:hypothetical protein